MGRKETEEMKAPVNTCENAQICTWLNPESKEGNEPNK